MAAQKRSGIAPKVMEFELSFKPLQKITEPSFIWHNYQIPPVKVMTTFHNVIFKQAFYEQIYVMANEPLTVRHFSIIQVLVHDSEGGRKQCKATGDPHFVTFDGL